jgi:hypothetical protein
LDSVGSVWGEFASAREFEVAIRQRTRRLYRCANALNNGGSAMATDLERVRADTHEEDLVDRLSSRVEDSAERQAPDVGQTFTVRANEGRGDRMRRARPRAADQGDAAGAAGSQSLKLH